MQQARSPRSPRSFWHGVAEALLVPLAFVALGVAWWGAARPAEARPAAYAAVVHGSGELWLVDGFNVVQVALLAGRDRSGWWTAPRREALLAQARGFEGAGSGAVHEVWVAFDGRRAADPEPGPVRSVYAPSADAWLLARVAEAPDPGRVRVVTADRRLAARVRQRGAQVVSPRAFLDRCGSGAAPAPPGASAI